MTPEELQRLKDEVRGFALCDLERAMMLGRPLREVIIHAIDRIVQGKIDCLLAFQFQYQMPADPQKDVVYGGELLDLALEKAGVK
jgi:hypothetical protein